MDNQKKKLPINSEDKIVKPKNTKEETLDSVLIGDELSDDDNSIYEEGLEEVTAEEEDYNLVVNNEQPKSVLGKRDARPENPMAQQLIEIAEEREDFQDRKKTRGRSLN